MANTPPGVVSPARYAFALGTFHTCVLVVVGVLLAYRSSGLAGLSDLNTVLGLALFGVLWVASVYGTGWALRGVHVHELHEAMGRGIGGGIRAAWLVLVVVIAAFVAAGLVGERRAGEALLAVFLVAAFLAVAGGIVATVVGGALGFVFGILDWVVLAAAGLRPAWNPEDGDSGGEVGDDVSEVSRA